MLHEGLIEVLNHGRGSTSVVFYEIQFIEWLFLLSGGLTLLYMIRLFLCIFVKTNSDLKKQQEFDENKNYMRISEKILLAISSLPFFAIGLIPLQYYTWENVKGAAISLGIGILLLVLLRKKDVILLQWDLEDRVYQPLLWYLDIGFSTVFRILDRTVDTIIVITRHSFYRDAKLPHELPEGSYGTHLIGSLADKIYDAYLRMHHIHKKRRVTIEHKLALLEKEIGENEDIIRRSMSFGLMIATFGLLLTIIYMLAPFTK